MVSQGPTEEPHYCYDDLEVSVPAPLLDEMSQWSCHQKAGPLKLSWFSDLRFELLHC
jgi:hypothetical protein